jgi:hypothetical protein
VATLTLQKNSFPLDQFVDKLARQPVTQKFHQTRSINFFWNDFLIRDATRGVFLLSTPGGVGDSAACVRVRGWRFRVRLNQFLPAAARHFLNQKGYSQVVVPERCIDLLARSISADAISSFPLLCYWCARSLLHHSSLSIGHGVDIKSKTARI